MATFGRTMMTLGGLLTAALTGASCNAITGVDDLAVDPAADVVPFVAVSGVSITEIALYQGIKIDLVMGGQPAAPGVPIVTGRDGLLRVFVALDGGYDGREVTGRMFLGDEEKPIEVKQVLSGTSTDDQLGSTLDFDVPGAAITGDFKYRVEIGRTAKSKGAAPVSYPVSGSESAPSTSVGKTLKLTIVPVSYGADGSGRLPDLSEQQIAAYKNAFHAMYPVPEVEVTVRDAVPWQQQIRNDGGGWGELLQHITDLRQQDGVAPDVYYYAAFEPKADFGAFCSQGCVLGLANLAQGPTDSWARASIGIGYPGRDTIETALHEIGHTHGREHSPCQTGDADPQYPYPDGSDGAWGFDMDRRMIFPPTMPDIMGYCVPMWISDYTYQALLTRIKAVNNARVEVPAELRDRLYDRAMVGPDGTVKWIDSIHLPTPPAAQPTAVELETKGGTVSVTGAFYPYDHLAGGVLFWPATGQPYDAVRFQSAGKSFRLPR